MDQDSTYRLNLRQQRFVDLVLDGVPAGRAYEQAGYRVSSGVADTSAARLLRNVQVSRAISEARRGLTEASQIDRHFLVSYLESVLKTPIGHLDATSPLVQEATIGTQRDSQILTIKMVSKIEAAKLLCKIMGWTGPKATHDAAGTKISEIVHFIRSRTSNIPLSINFPQ